MAVKVKIEIIAHQRDGQPFQVTAYDDVFDQAAVGASLATKRIKDALEKAQPPIFGNIHTSEVAYNEE